VLVIADPKAALGFRASSAAFLDDGDGSAMSAYLASVMSQVGLGLESVVYGKPSGWAVAAIPVATLRQEEQEVIRDPIVDSPSPHPCDPAHALIVGEKKPKGRRERISQASPLVYLVS